MIEFAEMTSKWINIIYVWLEVIYIYTYIHTYIRLSWCTICRDIFTCEYLGHESSNKAGSSGVFHNSYPSGEPRQPRCHEDQEIFFSCNHCSLILGDTRWVSNTSRTKNLWNTKCRVLGSRMVVSKKNTADGSSMKTSDLIRATLIWPFFLLSSLEASDAEGFLVDTNFEADAKGLLFMDRAPKSHQKPELLCQRADLLHRPFVFRTPHFWGWLNLNEMPIIWILLGFNIGR